MYKTLQKLVAAPIFLFQMGKVGSSSLHATLSHNYSGLVVHAHNYSMLTEKQKLILRWRQTLNLPIYVICPVRDPISRNFSAFFHNFSRDTGLEFSDKEWKSDELLDLFLRCYPHNVCLEWFDEHLRNTFSFDVFSESFSIDKKWKIYKSKSTRILIYRSDLNHSKQLDLISGFVGRKISEWTYTNMSADKNYGEIYKKFIDSVKLPDVYLSIMCDSRFCRKFWSEEEIMAIKDRFREKCELHKV